MFEFIIFSPLKSPTKVKLVQSRNASAPILVHFDVKFTEGSNEQLLNAFSSIFTTLLKSPTEINLTQSQILPRFLRHAAEQVMKNLVMA